MTLEELSRPAPIPKVFGADLVAEASRYTSNVPIRTSQPFRAVNCHKPSGIPTAARCFWTRQPSRSLCPRAQAATARPPLLIVFLSDRSCDLWNPRATP